MSFSPSEPAMAFPWDPLVFLVPWRRLSCVRGSGTSRGATFAQVRDLWHWSG